jgi:AcrR family transcriptional regulator
MKEIKIKKPKQKRSIDKIDAILSACPRVFNEFGYEKSTTERIALEAGVSIGTLYDYFSSKEAVFIAYLDRELSKTLESVAAKAVAPDIDPHSMTREYVRMGIDFICTQREILRIILSDFPSIIPEMNFVKSTRKQINVIGMAFEKNEKIRPQRKDSKVIIFTVSNIFLGVLFRMVAMPDDGFDRELMVDELTGILNHYVYGETR